MQTKCAARNILLQFRYVSGGSGNDMAAAVCGGPQISHLLAFEGGLTAWSRGRVVWRQANGKKPAGCISQQAVPDVLRSFFPTKTEQRLQELVELLSSHQEDGMVAYKPLFLEDEDFNQVSLASHF